MRWRATTFVAALALPVAAACQSPSPAPPVVSPPGGAPGAVVLGSRAEATGYQPQETAKALVPTAADAADDTAMAHSPCHAPGEEGVVRRCVLQDGSGPSVLLAGDSHAGQWGPAFQQVARKRRWRLEMATKSSCPLIETPLLDSTFQPYTRCAAWVRDLMATLTGPHHPDVVVVSHSNYLQFVPSGGPGSARQQRLVVAETATLARVKAAGVRVVLLRDTPEFLHPVPACIQGNPRRFTDCGDSRTSALSRAAAGQSEVATQLGLPLVDLSDVVCPRGFCPAVVGDVVVWRDTNHMTATYARSAGGYVQEVFPKV